LKTNNKLLNSSLGMIFLSQLAVAASSSNQPKAVQPWRLNEFVSLAETQPTRLLRVGNALFAKDRLARVSADSSLAFEWQDRMACLTALSTFFSPELSRKINAQQLAHARRLISWAMINDPALFVRDGAVESIRRIIRMQPADTFSWKADLEKAFLDRKNIVANEGLFIRETILTAMREANLKPSGTVIRIAKKDLNQNVKEQLKLWDTQAFDEIRSR